MSKGLTEVKVTLYIDGGYDDAYDYLERISKVLHGDDGRIVGHREDITPDFPLEEMGKLVKDEAVILWENGYPDPWANWTMP